MSKRTKVLRGIVHILMALYIVVILFPLLWMVLSGFKSDADIFFISVESAGELENFKLYLCMDDLYTEVSTQQFVLYSCRYILCSIDLRHGGLCNYQIQV